MKKLTTLLLMFLSIVTYSQKLDFDQYLSFLDRDMPFVNDFLLGKEWTIHSFDSKKLEKSYRFSEKGSIKEFVQFIYFNDNDIYGLRIFTYSTKTYNQYINRLDALNFVFKTQETFDNGTILKHYRNNENNIFLRIAISHNDSLPEKILYELYLVEEIGGKK